jgi:HEAT repeat protein
MYEPYQFTSYKNFRDKRKLRYPGKVPYAGEAMDWNRQQVENYFAPLFAWAWKQGIPNNRLVNGEFGCYRRNDGCQAYLTDVIAALNAHNLHWAFYSFREDEWNGMDYEVGTRGLGAEYWAAKEAGQRPEIPRHDNPLFDVIKREFTPGMGTELRRLVEALSSDEWRKREQAVETLGNLGPRAGGVIGHLIERLADEQWHVRKAAAIALTYVGPVTDQAVPSLITALADEEWHVRKAAAGALAAIGPDAYPAVPQLMESLLDWEWQVRSPAALALGVIGPKAKPAIDRLVYVMDDEEWKVRKHAAQALEAIGVPSESVLSALRNATDDDEDQVRRAASQALNKLTAL